MRIHGQKRISKRVLMCFFLSVSLAFGISGCAKETEPIPQSKSKEQNRTSKIEDTNDTAEEEKNKNEDKKGTTFDEISDYLWEQAKETYSPYYQVAGFKIFNYKENVNGDSIEAVLNMTVFHKNFDKDPDTVGYIKEAKEKNDPNYQIYYDEYLAVQELNLEIKVTIEDGEITLYMDWDPRAGQRDWKEFEMSQTIMK